ncbi:putative F-box protein PP2-B12 [Zingiber officinale]|uniref:F-box domain-containing protein n=1 Tax=Zingiber officinale TaxID=94328 RepID=A0A8J5G3E5_ZINOF|nr:putative F-box protein PP2-B12 [Zingiber officinale]KAG6498901.1 hypothetical protein ZIOFF_038652 [Zingiber officinale]
MGKEKEDSGIEKLPEGCIAHAIAHTSPLDACRSSAVSTAFRAAADSDLVWGRFLPADTPSILSSALRPFEYSSKRDLFFRLCDPILIDGGKMGMWLERSTGAKCYMISVRELTIVWGETPEYLRWISLPDSRFPEVAVRFPEVAELVNVCWLEIRGSIQSKLLTPKTTYAAYLIFKLAYRSRGLDDPPQQASVKVGLRSSTTLVCLQPRSAAARERRIRMGESDPPTLPLARDNGWMEVAIGEFYNDEGEDGEVAISFTEIKGGHWKKGLIVEGIEIRPKHRK